MKKDNYKNQNFEENSKVVTYCPICNLKFDLLKAQIVQENEEAHLIYSKCSKCKSNIVAVVFYNDVGLSSIGMVTDLSFDELTDLKERSKIELDDILDFHLRLKRKNFVKEFFK